MEVEFNIATRVRGRGNDAVNASAKDFRLQKDVLSVTARVNGTHPPLPLHTPQSSLNLPLPGVSHPEQEDPSPPQIPHASITFPLEKKGREG